MAASLLVLLLAQVLSGILVASAIRKTAFDATVTAVRIVGHDWSFRIQNALRFGKPITQMFGLSDILADIRADLPILSGVLVTLPDGAIVESNATGALPAGLASEVKRLLSREPGGGSHRTTGVIAQTQLGERYVFVMPVSLDNDRIVGALVMLAPTSVVSQAASGSIADALTVLASMTVIGGIGLVVCTFLLITGPDGRQDRWKIILFPAFILMLAQGMSSWYNITTFRDAYVAAATGNVQRSVDRFATDLQRLVSKGVRLDRLSGYDSPFGRMAADIPELARVGLTDGADRPIAEYGAPGSGAVYAPIGRDISGPDGTVVARLSADLSEAAIGAGLRRRVLDAGTVLLTSALFGIELLVLFGTLMRQGPVRGQEAGDRDGHHLLARTASFLLVFAWALPLSFVPLQMGTLSPEPLFGLSRAVTLALPISAEMGCALVTALIAGVMTDRRGWHVPFILGGLVCAAGALAATSASGAIGFIGARAVVGLGYGLAWMGIQGYVFTWSSPRTRAQAMANLVAGIFAGQICGNVTGAMLADQIGFSAVFVGAAAAGVVPVLFAFAFMKPWFGRPGAAPADAAREDAQAAPAPLPTAPQAGSALAGLLADRNFLALLLLSVMPFSIAQVGLIYYTLPVYLAQQGIDQSNIGRIMMIYGLSVIYIAPLLSRWVDRYERKKPFIVLGGFLGGLGLAVTYLDIGIAALVGSVFLLGLASSLGGPAQSSFALHLPSVHRLGTGRAMGIQRASDKLGQMLGPLALGSLFTLLGTRDGLAVTGAYYLGCTVLFLLIARDRKLARA